MSGSTQDRTSEEERGGKWGERRHRDREHWPDLTLSHFTQDKPHSSKAGIDFERRFYDTEEENWNCLKEEKKHFHELSG